MLEEVRSALLLLQGAVGWKVGRVTAGDVQFVYTRADLSVAFALDATNGNGGGKSLVTAIAFDSAHVV